MLNRFRLILFTITAVICVLTLGTNSVKGQTEFYTDEPELLEDLTTEVETEGYETTTYIVEKEATSMQTEPSVKVSESTTPSTSTISKTMTSLASTTPEPTEEPAPDRPDLARFTVYNTEKGNTVCIIVELRSNITIPYFTLTGEQRSLSFLVPKNSSYTGVCTWNGTRSITVMVRPRWSLTAVWARRADDALQTYAARVDESEKGAALNMVQWADSNERGLYALVNISFSYNLDNETFPNTNQTGDRTVYSYSINRFETRVGDYYACSSLSQLLVEDVTFEFEDMRLQSYLIKNTTRFSGDVVRCLNDIPVNNAIPVAVAIALAILIVAILLAYFIAYQRKKEDEDYQAMLSTPEVIDTSQEQA